MDGRANSSNIQSNPRILRWLTIGVFASIGLAILLGRTQRGPQPTQTVLPQVVTPVARHEVQILKPDRELVVALGITDANGKPMTAGCATCHTTKPPNPEARLGTDLKMFHQGLKGAHGSLACTACHSPSDGYATFKLADGKSVPHSEVMQLCAQCHGPQYRDYLHGAHGGMTGHWDLSKGPRLRNNCVDCHDAHSPKFPTVRPAPGPNDRDPAGTKGHK